MVVPLKNIFQQRPHISTVQSLISQYKSEEDQNLLVESVNDCDLEYKNDILKLLITKLESTNSEVSSEVWEKYYELKTPQKITEMKMNFGLEHDVRYFLNDTEFVTIKENRSSLVAHGDTGHRTWESSLVLTEFICTTLKSEKFQTVIELGAGTGLVSLALAKLGVCNNILCTDGSVQVIENLKTLVKSNDVGGMVKPVLFSWDDLETAKKLPKNTVVFAGDILYGMQSSYQSILNTLKVLKPSSVYFCNPIRNLEGYNAFFELCKQSGVKVTVINRLNADGNDDTQYMFLASVPPIPVELIKLELV